MNQYLQDPEERTFFERFRIPIIAGVLILLGGGVYFLVKDMKPAPKKRTTVSMIDIMPAPPPPPPPTPPPSTPPPPEEPPPETQDQPEFQPEDAPVEQAPEPEAPEEAAAMGTDLQGDGPDGGFGLKQGGGGGLIGGKGTGSGQGGSKYGWYAAKVQNSVSSAIRSNRRTRSSALSVKVKIWADENGRVSRAILAGTSGDAALDQTLREEVLTGLQLPEPPPEGMPMPINMRITATRP